MLGKTCLYIEKTARLLILLSFLTIIGAVLLQLLGRNVLSSAPVWTEELTRFGLLFLVAFGLGPALRTGDLVNVDLFCEGLSGRKPWFLRLLCASLTALMCALLIEPAWRFAEIGAFQTSPALGWRMDIIHGSMLLALLSLLGYSLARIVGMLTGQSDGLPQRSLEEES